MSDFPKIQPMGERGILIEFEPEINENLLKMLLFYREKLEEFYSEVNVEVINTYNSLLISYMFSIENLYNEVLVIKELFGEAKIGKINNRKIFHLPVCYEEEFGWDLELIAKKKNCQKQKLSNFIPGHFIRCIS